MKKEMQFQRTIGIDYSGAKTADSSNKGLRVYITDMEERNSVAREVPPPKSERRKKYWTRREIFEWLLEELSKPTPTIVGIDHAFSFPKCYFEKHTLKPSWDEFLKDFCKHWRTDEKGVTPYSLRKKGDKMASARCGKATWYRKTEKNNSAKSVFHFNVPGQVALSTHAGLPFLLRIRESLPDLCIWPFDDWQKSRSKSCLVEVYPSLWSKCYPNENRTQDQHDAYAVASWLRDADKDGRLEKELTAKLPKEAKYEGWIIGTPPD